MRRKNLYHHMIIAGFCKDLLKCCRMPRPAIGRIGRDECSDFENPIGRPAKAGLSGNRIFVGTGLRRELKSNESVGYPCLHHFKSNRSLQSFLPWSARYFALFGYFFMKTHEEFRQTAYLEFFLCHRDIIKTSGKDQTFHEK
jgi:hypothetical protein